MFDATHVKHKETFLREISIKLQFQVSYRRELFVISIVYYFSDHNRGIQRATTIIT